MRRNYMTPKEIVGKLDERVVGQNSAKRVVAVAIRNRWRRLQLPTDVNKEITPKNILMIGPTGVGKTQISRYLSLVTNAPFIKVEATNFSEIGYVGRTVDTIIQELVSVSIRMVRKEKEEKVWSTAISAAEERILDELLSSDQTKDKLTREFFRKKLRSGDLDNKKITISLRNKLQTEDFSDISKMLSQIQDIKEDFSGGGTLQKCTRVRDALKLVLEEETQNLIKEQEIVSEAIKRAEENGIVFIDEIDKIADNNNQSADVSRGGVQRDLLSIIEGSSVQTQYGSVNTDHILFIASGAFHMSKPSDLLPELQGRLPLKVQLDPLTQKDFERILHSMITYQYKPLLMVDGIDVEFTKDSIKFLAKITERANEHFENIGARRLHEIMEHLLEEISFNFTDSSKKSIKISNKYIKKSLSHLLLYQDYDQLVL